MEQEEVIFLEEVQLVDQGLMVACCNKDLITKEDPADSQLEVAINAPTQGDPGVPARSQDVEAALQSIPILS